MQDIRPADVSALCAACHELSQTGAPLIVVGAGLPHLPPCCRPEVVLRAAVPLPPHRPAGPGAADLALIAPAAGEDVEFTPDALDALYAATDGYPYFVQAYGKVTWDAAPASRSPPTT